ncbi:MAG: 2-dehydro-3-deoxyphosphooctonate aldolase [Gemmatimonadales bacterium]|nr:MAG: 2-dehydro-3-deoxyphosphooctonate aldolase [Gemmatimonadales bacterium]
MSLLFEPSPLLIAGPCVLESDRVNLAIAEALAALGQRLNLRVIYKGSFDKANRSAPDAPRGPGLEAGLEALVRVREATGLPVLTDVHEPDQAARAAQSVDALQVPAFLCRQTDLLEAVGRTGKAVNIKKGQWMAPEAMAGAVAKVERGRSLGVRADGAVVGKADIAVTERGTFFGYGDLVVDMRSFARLKQATGVCVLFDATHSVQQPGRGPRGESGGTREHIPALLLAAAAAGAEGFFMETHPDPESSPSDRATVWPLAALGDLVERAVEVWHAARARSGAAL